MRLVPNNSYLTCLPLKLVQMNRSDVDRMISLGQKEIVGRGRISYPNAEEGFIFVKKGKRKRSQPRYEVVPFTYDSPYYQYVLAKRTHYLMHEEDNFVRTDYKMHCHEHQHQHVDLELSEYIVIQ